jgi:adenine deaminase
VVADPERDLAKIAVIERHHGTGRVGLGLVRGFALKAGAFASTVAHDAHNLVVVGVDDADMALCAERAQALGGGLVVARDGAVVGELALPIAGLLSDAPLEEVAEGLEHLQDLLAEQGVTIGAPFMTLSFLALSVIPSLKITDRGLVDVDAFRLVPLELDGREAFVARFGALYEHSPWVAERAWRPEGFAGIDELDAALRAAMYSASRDEQLALIRAHPDLGEKVAPLTEHSRGEQATLALSAADYDRFATSNAAYRAKFGIPFVVCVREHSKASVLANADARLGNSVEQEIETALGEIAKIARLRLEDAL